MLNRLHAIKWLETSFNWWPTGLKEVAKTKVVENSTNRCVLAWDCGAGHYFAFLIRRHLVSNIFPFPVSTAKLLGDFYYNRRSAGNSFPRFAYSFVFLMLHQYYWSCDSYSANRRSAANIKNLQKVCIGATNSPRFAYRCSEHFSASPFRAVRHAVSAI